MLAFKHKNAIASLCSYMQDNVVFNFSFMDNSISNNFDLFAPDLKKQVRGIVEYFIERIDNGMEMVCSLYCCLEMLLTLILGINRR
jgi:hypothetical protein